MAEDKSGWLFIIGSPKWHYFDNSLISLCGKWMVFSLKAVEPGNNESIDNCMQCRKKLEKKVENVRTKR